MTETCSYCLRYKTIFPPRNNCKTCWNKFFMAHPAKCTAIDHVIKTRGEEVAISVLGEKFVKFYKLFKLQHQGDTR